MNEYDEKLCKNIHKNIDKEHKAIWDRIKGIEFKFWTIIILQIGFLGTIIGLLLKISHQ